MLCALWTTIGRLHHRDGSQRPFTCLHTSPPFLLAHFAISTKKCNQCDSASTLANLLMTHMSKIKREITCKRRQSKAIFVSAHTSRPIVQQSRYYLHTTDAQLFRRWPGIQIVSLNSQSECLPKLNQQPREWLHHSKAIFVSAHCAH